MNGFDEWFSTEYAIRLWDPLKDTVNPYYHNGKVATGNLEGCDSRIVMDLARGPVHPHGGRSRRRRSSLSSGSTRPHGEPVVAGPEFLAMYPGRAAGERNYYGVITALDVQMGRLRQELRELGAAENTMLWFASDNGPEGDTGDRGTTRGSAAALPRSRKRRPLGRGIHVPGLVEWPARIKPRTTAVPCSTLDYFPTTLEVLGYKMNGRPEPIDGVSLVPLFEGKTNERPVPIPFETPGGTGSKPSRGSPRMALVDNRYKLLTDMEGPEDVDQLFDLVRDPGETTNLAGQQPEVVRSMKGKLVDFRASCQRSLAGKDYAEPFTPDKDDVHPSQRGAGARKAADEP